MIFARLLTLTRYIEMAAQYAALPRRTVIRLTADEWNELCADPQFAKIHDGQTYTIMNNVLIRVETPASKEPSGIDPAKLREHAAMRADVTPRKSIDGTVSSEQDEFERSIADAISGTTARPDKPHD